MRTVQIAPRLARRGMAAPPRWRRITLFWRKRRALMRVSSYVAAATPVAVATHVLERPVHHVLQLFDLRRRYLEQRVAQRTAASPGTHLQAAAVPGHRPVSVGTTATAMLPARLWRTVAAVLPALRNSSTGSRSNNTLVHRRPLARAALSDRAVQNMAPVGLHVQVPAAPRNRRLPRAALPAARAVNAVRHPASLPLVRHARLTPGSVHLPRMPAALALAARHARLQRVHHAAPLPLRPTGKPAAGVAPLALAWGLPHAMPAAPLHEAPAPAPAHADTAARSEAVASVRASTDAREAARQEIITALHCPANLERLARDVMVRIDKHLRIERERRGR